MECVMWKFEGASHRSFIAASEEEATFLFALGDQWTGEAASRTRGTEEILATLDASLKLNPNHPFANHLFDSRGRGVAES